MTPSSTLAAPSVTKGQAKARQYSPIVPAPNNPKQGVNLSSEAQYLFEVDKHLSKLMPEELDKALEYLFQSDDPLQIKAADHFKQGQEYLNSILEGKPIVLAEDPSDREEKLLDKNFVHDETTEIALRPPGVDVFRLDGKSNFTPVIFGGHNTALNSELDSLEAQSKGVLGNKDHANIHRSIFIENFGTPPRR